MTEKMLVTQALDERELLVKKITDKIEKAKFVDTIRPNEDKVAAERVTQEEFAQQEGRAYQQILDLIDRYQKIDVAVVASNAVTKIETNYGTFTVAGAISLQSRQLQQTAESMRLFILGKDSKVKDEKPLDVVDTYVRENTTELVDPLDVKKKIEKLKEKRDILLTELDTQIKVSNATTFIEI